MVQFRVIRRLPPTHDKRVSTRRILFILSTFSESGKWAVVPRQEIDMPLQRPPPP